MSLHCFFFFFAVNSSVNAAFAGESSMEKELELKTFLQGYAISLCDVVRIQCRAKV